MKINSKTCPQTIHPIKSFFSSKSVLFQNVNVAHFQTKFRKSLFDSKTEKDDCLFQTNTSGLIGYET